MKADLTVVADSITKISITVKCRICLSMLREPMRTLNCGHFFCRSCVDELFSSKNVISKCPLCNHRLPTKRSLVSSPKFSEIVKKSRLLMSSFNDDVANLIKQQASGKQNVESLDKPNDPYEYNAIDERAKDSTKPVTFRSFKENQRGKSSENFTKGDVTSRPMEKSPSFSSDDLFNEPTEQLAAFGDPTGDCANSAVSQSVEGDDLGRSDLLSSSFGSLSASTSSQITDYVPPEEYDGFKEKKMSQDVEEQLDDYTSQISSLFKSLIPNDAKDFELPKDILTPSQKLAATWRLRKTLGLNSTQEIEQLSSSCRLQLTEFTPKPVKRKQQRASRKAKLVADEKISTPTEIINDIPTPSEELPQDATIVPESAVSTLHLEEDLLIPFVSPIHLVDYHNAESINGVTDPVPSPTLILDRSLTQSMPGRNGRPALETILPESAVSTLHLEEDLLIPFVSPVHVDYPDPEPTNNVMDPVPSPTLILDRSLTQPMPGRNGRAALELAPDSELIVEETITPTLNEDELDHSFDTVPDSTILCEDTQKVLESSACNEWIIKNGSDIKNLTRFLWSQVGDGRTVKLESWITTDMVYKPDLQDERTEFRTRQLSSIFCDPVSEFPDDATTVGISTLEATVALDPDVTLNNADIPVHPKVDDLQETRTAIISNEHTISSKEPTGQYPIENNIHSSQDPVGWIDSNENAPEHASNATIDFPFADDPKNSELYARSVSESVESALDKTLEFTSDDAPMNSGALAIDNVISSDVLGYRCSAADSQKGSQNFDYGLDAQMINDLNNSGSIVDNRLALIGVGADKENFHGCAPQPLRIEPSGILPWVLSSGQFPDHAESSKPFSDIFSKAKDGDVSSISNKVIICFTGFKPEVSTLNRFLDMFGVELRQTYSPDVTHVVTSAAIIDNRYCSLRKTLTFYLAIASRKWLISSDWILQSILQERILDPEGFEIIGDTVSGPFMPSRRDRLAGDALLSDMSFYVHGEITGAFQRSHYETLITEAGGNVLPSFEELKNASTLGKYVLAERTNDQKRLEEIENFYLKDGLVIANTEWFLDSIVNWDFTYYKEYLQSLEKNHVMDANDSNKAPKDVIVVTI